MVNTIHGPKIRPVGYLAPHEDRVAKLIAQGLTNQEISEVLGIEKKSVENYCHQVYVALGIDGGGNPRVRAASYYLSGGDNSTIQNAAMRYTRAILAQQRAKSHLIKAEQELKSARADLDKVSLTAEHL